MGFNGIGTGSFRAGPTKAESGSFVKLCFGFRLFPVNLWLFVRHIPALVLLPCPSKVGLLFCLGIPAFPHSWEQRESGSGCLWNELPFVLLILLRRENSFQAKVEQGAPWI